MDNEDGSKTIATTEAVITSQSKVNDKNKDERDIIITVAALMMMTRMLWMKSMTVTTKGPV